MRRAEQLIGQVQQVDAAGNLQGGDHAGHRGLDKKQEHERKGGVEQEAGANAAGTSLPGSSPAAGDRVEDQDGVRTGGHTCKESRAEPRD